jgi:hypothetical protein
LCACTLDDNVHVLAKKIDVDEILHHKCEVMGFIQKWFGFNGWQALSTSGSVGATILYRILFVVGLAVSIIAYSYISGGEDPSIIWIAIVGLVWFLIFQFIINLIFVNSS